LHAGSPAPPVLPEDSRARLFRHAWQAYVLLLSALGAALFLGGWQIPGLARERVDGHVGWTAVGAALYLSKTWILTLVSLGLPAILPPVGDKQAMRRAWRCLVPLSLMALLLLFVWSACAWGPRPAAEAAFGSLLFGIVTGTLFYVAVRVRRSVVSPPMELDPFV
jgi:NADH-quinone oxidoreductase subunit H